MERQFKNLSLDDQRSERPEPTTAPTADHAAKPPLPPNCQSTLSSHDERVEQGERRQRAYIAEFTDAREIPITATSLPPLYPLKSNLFTR